MRTYYVTLWNNASNWSHASGTGVIEKLYVRASDIPQAVAKAMAYAKKQRYTSCRVSAANEVDEPVLT